MRIERLPTTDRVTPKARRNRGLARDVSKRKYHLVDFAARFQKGFRNHIVSIRGVPKLVKTFNGYGCYATCFFYSDEVLTYMSAHAPAPTPTIAGYEGKVWAHFLPIDLDHPDLGAALDAARRLASLFLERWAVPSEAIQVYFSGSKGFHLMLDTRLFGKIPPSKSLPLLFAAMRRHLSLKLSETQRKTMDLAIKDRVRLLRLPNTVHEKSGLYKILLDPSELQRLGPEEIRQYAKAPRPLAATDETGLVPRVSVRENPMAAKFYRRIRQQVRRVIRKSFRNRFRRPEDSRQIAFPCAGAQRIWESHVEPGQRNNCAIRLASELRLLGLSEEETREKLFKWNETNRIDLPAHELEGVIRSAYQRRFPYRYGCWDPILRQFCPLPDHQACRAYVQDRTLREPA